MTVTIGLTGLPQSGKTELEQVFVSCGFTFLNLNRIVGGNMRCAESPLRPRYDELVPKGIRPDGKHSLEYYACLANDPGLIEKILEMEEPRCIEEANRLVQSGEKIVVNWEYHFRNLGSIPLDHLLVLNCFDESVWFERLRIRAQSRATIEREFDSDLIRQFMAAALYEWSRFETALATCPFPYTVLDTSASDWGEKNLRRELAKFA
jgi:dephospho-CoA kinase